MATKLNDLMICAEELSEAEQELARAREQKRRCMEDLAMLNADIPMLVDRVAAAKAAFKAAATDYD